MLKNSKIELKGLTENELETFFINLNEPKFRAKQLFNWLYNHQISNFELMDNFPKALRSKLAEIAEINSLDIVDIKSSGDYFTKKLLLKTYDNRFIESVLIPGEERNTLCISTQVGCPLDCKFCATGVMGYKRNLTAGEIIDQYIIACRTFGKDTITNIVYMGMGEPLLNYENTLKSLDILTNEKSVGISRNRITLSTAGIPNKIKALADSGIKVKLALSLHSTFNDIRTLIMPINKKYPLEVLIDALKYYTNKLKSRITYEYTMLKGINDREEDIKGLARICSQLPSKINIIPFNSIKHIEPNGISATLEPTPFEEIEIFANKLREKNITVMLRDTRGNDIAAACGQLAIKQQKK